MSFESDHAEACKGIWADDKLHHSDTKETMKLYDISAVLEEERRYKAELRLARKLNHIDSILAARQVIHRLNGFKTASCCASCTHRVLKNKCTLRMADLLEHGKSLKVARDASQVEPTDFCNKWLG